MKKRKKNRCDFEPTWGIAQKVDMDIFKDAYGIRSLRGISEVVGKVSGACSRSYYIEKDYVMLKVAAKSKKAARKAKNKLNEYGFDISEHDIYPWHRADSFW